MTTEPNENDAAAKPPLPTNASAEPIPAIPPLLDHQSPDRLADHQTSAASPADESLEPTKGAVAISDEASTTGGINAETTHSSGNSEDNNEHPQASPPPPLPIAQPEAPHPLSVPGGATMPNQSTGFGQQPSQPYPNQGQSYPPQDPNQAAYPVGYNPYYQQFHPIAPANPLGQQPNHQQGTQPYYPTQGGPQQPYPNSGYPQQPPYTGAPNQGFGQPNFGQQAQPYGTPIPGQYPAHPTNIPYGSQGQYPQGQYPNQYQGQIQGQYQGQYQDPNQPNPFGNIVAPPNYTGPNGNHNVEKPKTWLIEAILVAVLCCQPLGIAAIVNAANVNARYNAGDYQGAKLASDAAKRWIIWGVILAVVIGFVVVAFQFIMVFGFFRDNVEVR